MKSYQPGRSIAHAFLFISTTLALHGCFGSWWSETGSDTIRMVTNKGGETLGYVTTSDVTLLTVDRSRSRT